MKSKDVKVNSYLSFRLGEEEYALHVNKVLSILEMTKLTEVPKAPDYMKGVISLRGKVLPIIDTRVKLGMKEAVYTDKTCIIVMELNIDNKNVLVGALVDEVSSVLEVDSNEIQLSPQIGNKYRATFIDGMVTVNDKYIMLLNIEMLFTLDELIVLESSVKQKEVENQI